MGRTTNEIRERIAKREEKLNRKLSDEEVRKITKYVKRKVNRERFIRGAFLAAGITIGAGGHALITSGNGEKNQIGNKQTESQIDDGRKEFVKGLTVEVKPTISEEKENLQIRNSIENEIEELETPEEVLNYIKEIYIKEYNEQNNENYTSEQLKLRKARNEEKLHLDTATNGETIIKEGYEKDNYVDTEAGIITVSIDGDNNYINEKIVNYGHGYKTVYPKDAIVDKYEDNLLVDLAPVVDSGIDWSVAMDKEENSEEIKEEYKKRLIDSVTEYETEKTNENIQQNEEPEI